MSIIKHINEDYLDDIEKDDLQLGAVEVDDNSIDNFQYQLDVKLGSWRSLWFKRLSVYLKSCPLIINFDIRIAYGKKGDNDEAFFYGFEDKMEQDKELHDDYKSWRIRFNMRPGRPARIMKYIREIVTLADNYRHVKDDFVFELRDIINKDYQPVNLKYMIAVMDNRFRQDLNNFEQSRSFIQLSYMLQLLGVDYQYVLDYLMPRCDMCSSFYRRFMQKQCPTDSGTTELYLSSVIAGRLGYQVYQDNFCALHFNKSKILAYDGPSQLKFADTHITEKDDISSLEAKSLQSLAMVYNEKALDGLNETIVPISSDIRIIIKGRESKIVHMFILGCPHFGSMLHVAMMAIIQTINGKRGVDAAVKKLSKTYQELGANALEPRLIETLSRLISESF